MSGETEKDVSGWTVDTLATHLLRLSNERDRFYLEKFEAQDKAMSAALAASEKAIDKAEAANSKRFESVNEFRQTLADQTNTFITRSEAEAATARNTERIQELTNRINKSEGKGAGFNASWIYALGAVAAVGTIISLIIAGVSLFMVFKGN